MQAERMLPKRKIITLCVTLKEDEAVVTKCSGAKIYPFVTLRVHEVTNCALPYTGGGSSYTSL